MHALLHDLVQIEAPVDALSDEATVEIRERGDDRVDAPLGHLTFEAFEIEPSGLGRLHP